MAEKGSIQAQVKEITDKLEQGVKDLFSSDKYMAFLQTLARFHKYSTRNTLLIHMQKPDATLVAGYQSWQSKFGRNVKRGEHGIKILAPTPFTIKKEQQKFDPDTRYPILDPDGIPLTEEVEVRIPRFKVISVFDVSQTDGKPLPHLAEDLTGDVRHFELFMDALKAVSPLPVSFTALDPNTDGECHMGEKILIREGMSEIQTVSAVIHEIAHAKLHDVTLFQEMDESAGRKDRRTEEVEAESISFAVCQYYGIETASNSFGYVADWSKTRELKELNTSLDTIRKTAAELIDQVDAKFRELSKERGIDLASTHDEAEPQVAAPVTPETELLPNQHIETIDSTEFVFTTITPQPAPVVEPERVGEPVVVEPELPLPDSAIDISERDLYGYNDPDILPLLHERALELFDQDHTVYLLYEDNTEAMAFEREEIENHDGIFGIEAEEWANIVDFSQMKERNENSEGTKEALLLYGQGDAFGIYQLKDGDGTRDYRFESLDSIGARGLDVERGNYALVYTAPLESAGSDIQSTLDGLYEQFNIRRPDDFKGHSLSVSDIVLIKQDGNISSHYVDSFGFKELPSFTGCETPPEQRTQTYSQVGNTPTIAELEAEVKAGHAISLLDLANAVKNEPRPAPKGKTSILAQLQDSKKAAQGTDLSKAAPKRDGNREV